MPFFPTALFRRRLRGNQADAATVPGKAAPHVSSHSPPLAVCLRDPPFVFFPAFVFWLAGISAARAAALIFHAAAHAPAAKAGAGEEEGALFKTFSSERERRLLLRPGDCALRDEEREGGGSRRPRVSKKTSREKFLLHEGYSQGDVKILEKLLLRFVAQQYLFFGLLVGQDAFHEDALAPVRHDPLAAVLAFQEAAKLLEARLLASARMPSPAPSLLALFAPEAARGACGRAVATGAAPPHAQSVRAACGSRSRNASALSPDDAIRRSGSQPTNARGAKRSDIASPERRDADTLDAGDAARREAEEGQDEERWRRPILKGTAKRSVRRAEDGGKGVPHVGTSFHSAIAASPTLSGAGGGAQDRVANLPAPVWRRLRQGYFSLDPRFLLHLLLLPHAQQKLVMRVDSAGGGVLEVLYGSGECDAVPGFLCRRDDARRKKAHLLPRPGLRLFLQKFWKRKSPGLERALCAALATQSNCALVAVYRQLDNLRIVSRFVAISVLHQRRLLVENYHAFRHAHPRSFERHTGNLAGTRLPPESPLELLVEVATRAARVEAAESDDDKSDYDGCETKSAKRGAAACAFASSGCTCAATSPAACAFLPKDDRLFVPAPSLADGRADAWRKSAAHGVCLGAARARGRASRDTGEERGGRRAGAGCEDVQDALGEVQAAWLPICIAVRLLTPAFLGPRLQYTYWRLCFLLHHKIQLPALVPDALQATAAGTLFDFTPHATEGQYPFLCEDENFHAPAEPAREAKPTHLRRSRTAAPSRQQLPALAAPGKKAVRMREPHSHEGFQRSPSSVFSAPPASPEPLFPLFCAPRLPLCCFRCIDTVAQDFLAFLFGVNAPAARQAAAGSLPHRRADVFAAARGCAREGRGRRRGGKSDGEVEWKRECARATQEAATLQIPAWCTCGSSYIAKRWKALCGGSDEMTEHLTMGRRNRVFASLLEKVLQHEAALLVELAREERSGVHRNPRALGAAAHAELSEATANEKGDSEDTNRSAESRPPGERVSEANCKKLGADSRNLAARDEGGERGEGILRLSIDAFAAERPAERAASEKRNGKNLDAVASGAGGGDSCVAPSDASTVAGTDIALALRAFLSFLCCFSSPLRFRSSLLHLWDLGNALGGGAPNADVEDEKAVLPLSPPADLVRGVHTLTADCAAQPPRDPAERRLSTASSSRLPRGFEETAHSLARERHDNGVPMEGAAALFSHGKGGAAAAAWLAPGGTLADRESRGPPGGASSATATEAAGLSFSGARRRQGAADVHLLFAAVEHAFVELLLADPVPARRSPQAPPPQALSPGGSPQLSLPREARTGELEGRREEAQPAAGVEQLTEDAGRAQQGGEATAERPGAPEAPNERPSESAPDGGAGRRAGRGPAGRGRRSRAGGADAEPGDRDSSPCSASERERTKTRRRKEDRDERRRRRKGRREGENEKTDREREDSERAQEDAKSADARAFLSRCCVFAAALCAKPPRRCEGRAGSARPGRR
ncbi:hypothetical protein BESB_082830 [Besnoitia besnoiti]|uniref:Uncharacterized protein n=1 Tax=Besnoitia besnoiti TaxID=94643 RepID=A0A2A9M7C2_BESBE|nr:hypothetical protein BESB_082830 [Besnoitia besnoiti]PFH33084.1 hypothetical protein BESB_082830 [Besnoitia besnoiti]